MKFQFKGFTVDKDTRELTKAGKEIPLDRLTFDLLVYLCANKGLALAKERIVRDVWGIDYNGTTRALDQAISQVRKALGRERKAIITLHTIGYKFRP